MKTFAIVALLSCLAACGTDAAPFGGQVLVRGAGGDGGTSAGGEGGLGGAGGGVGGAGGASCPGFTTDPKTGLIVPCPEKGP